MKKKLFFNMSVLSISNMAVRLMGMAYKVWLAGMISPVALGLHQLAMSVYSVFITPIASGLPMATSRLCGKYFSENKEKQVLASAIRIALVPLCLSALILFLGKDIIAGLFLHDKQAGAVILTLIPAVTVGGLASLPAGLLHAGEKSFFPALFEIIEQFIKIGFAIITVLIFKNASVYFHASVPTLAVGIGGIVSFILMFSKTGKLNLKERGYEKELLTNALPPTFARMGTSLLHLGTTTILPLGLMAYGLSKEAALSQYGILTSIAYPVVFAPMTIISAISVVILPQIAKSLKDKKAVRHKFLTVFFSALIITVIFSVLLLLFAPYVAKELLNNSQAGTFMIMLIPSVIFLGLSQVCRTTLNGLGKQKTLMVTSIIDGFLGLILTYLLVWRFGIYGFIAGNCIQDFLAFVINFSICTYQIKKL